MTGLSKFDLSVMEDRALGATGGPWVAEHFWTGDRYLGSVVHPEGSRRSILMLVERTPCLRQGDAAFIAAARQDIPALAAEVRRLWQALREAQRRD